MLHREGTPTILITLAVVIVLNTLMYFLAGDIDWLRYTTYAITGLLLIIVLQFFRVPNRQISTNDGVILAPCDGKVVVIEEVDETEYFKEKRIQVSIFMSPINVHINWMPVAGKIEYSKYHPGLYLLAWDPKSSTDNERTTVVVKHQHHPAVLFRQIAGALARRIVCYPKGGEQMTQGEEMGFIKFGSRVDLLLPLDADIQVKIGDKSIGRQTVIAKFA